MLVQKILGNVSQMPLEGRRQDVLELEWYETGRRSQRKTTTNGLEIAMKFPADTARLQQGDILFLNEENAVVVHILPCEAVAVRPMDMFEMGSLCYEIGNRHLPAFIHNDKVLLPFEEPVFNWLSESGYKTTREIVQLLIPLNTSVQPHSHGNGSTLFSKLISLTAKT